MENITIEKSDGTLSEDTGTPVTTDAPPTSGSCDGGVSSNNKHTKRGRRAVPPSQAKRRLEAMATGIDYNLAAAFTAILILYTVITLGIWKSLEGQTFRHEVIEQTNENLISQQHGNGNSKNEHDNNSNTIENNIRAEDITDIDTLQHTFPVHASGDLEIIDHPGIFLASPEKMKEILQQHSDQLPADGKMTVPKFWRPKVYGPGGVREFLGNYGETLITPEQATQIGSFTEGLKTVYISVASYRDPVLHYLRLD